MVRTNRISIPEISPPLAYETGFHIGDGSMYIRKEKYEYCVCYYGNKQETEFYNDVILPLLLKLYSIRPKLKIFKNWCYIRIYSKELVNFKTKTLGLPVGNKNIMSIPRPLLRCGLELYVIAGIFDADGTVKKLKQNKVYPRIRLTLKNPFLLVQVKKLLSFYRIHSTLYCDRRWDKRIRKPKLTWDLDINGFSNVTRFVEKVPIRNPKHLKLLREVLKST